MSIADHEIDEPEVCSTHGEYLPCYLCLVDWAEEQAEWQIQDEKEGK